MNKPRSYGRYFELVKQLPAEVDEKDFRKDLVHEFTNGRTESLRDTDAAEYALMCGALEAKFNGAKADADTDGDYWRKRTMKAIAVWLKKNKREQNADLIKAIAVRAAGKNADGKPYTFNKIPLYKLRKIMKRFNGETEVDNAVDEITAEMKRLINMN